MNMPKLCKLVVNLDLQKLLKSLESGFWLAKISPTKLPKLVAYIFRAMESTPPLFHLKTTLHMNTGDGKYSYARNSSFQRSMISKAGPVIEKAVGSSLNKSFPQKYVIADLGCSSGPNSLYAISIILDTVFNLCKEREQTPPEILVFLNDLPSNDFNNVFSQVTKIYEELSKDRGHCFISGMPGSFYGRLFPTESVDFFHSSCCLHWLSQVPEGIANNKGNIYMSKTSPDNVYKAYLEEFKKGFTLFLRCRAEELLPNGQMVLTFVGRRTADPTSSDTVNFMDLIAKQIVQLSAEGFIKEADIDSFNLPMYNAYNEEVKAIIEEEGSFKIDSFKTFRLRWYSSSDDEENQNDEIDMQASGLNVAHCHRAGMESLLVGHFGKGIMDELFARYAKSVGEHLGSEDMKATVMIFSMTKKT